MKMRKRQVKVQINGRSSCPAPAGRPHGWLYVLSTNEQVTKGCRCAHWLVRKATRRENE